MITAIIALSIVLVLLFALLLWINWYSDVYCLSCRGYAYVNLAICLVFFLAALTGSALLGVVFSYVKHHP